MKTFLKSLIIASCLGLVSFSASLAETNPIGRPKAVASYKTGIYSTAEGKLNIALDKETAGAVDVHLKNDTGKILFSQRIAKNEKTSRIRLDMSNLEDGTYQLEITNGVETTIHAISISTKRPNTPSRLVAIN